jgi:murein L,D-transpeptidase YcbB/YkuD
MLPQLRLLALSLLIGSLLPILQACAQAADGLSVSLQQMLDADRHRDPVGGNSTRQPDALRALYTRRDFAPIWQRWGKPTAQARRLVQVLRESGAYGLRPSDYDADSIDAQMRELLAGHDAPVTRRAGFDLRLSAAALKLARHLHYGRVDPRACGFELYKTRSDLDETALIDRLASSRNPVAELAAIEPPFNHYRLLKTALAKYRQLASAGTPTDLPGFSGRSIKPGERYAGAGSLRRLLVALGDLAADAAADSTADNLDEGLVSALRKFQERNALVPDGTLGPRTLAELTVPIAQRVRQIELTLERWRWLRPFETPPIVVNLPAFRLYAFRTTDDRESDMLKMDVIVGQSYPETQTPVFMAELKYVVFRPYWDVPDTIVQREMLPAFRSDPGFFEKNHLELVSGRDDDSPTVPTTSANVDALASGALRLRQRPGRDNALGAIKFVLPNYHSVYLHSTPARNLFRESRRAFSHGCIRVSDPVGLAEHVLRNSAGNWTAERIDAAMKGDPNQRVNLSKPIQVLLLYGTAMATESGQVLFFDDLYGHDRRLEKLLRARNE